MSGTFREALRAGSARGSLYAVPDTDIPVQTCADAEEPTDADIIAGLQREVEELRAAIRSRATIEQATGMVMLCYGLSAEQASKVLFRWSSLWSIKQRAVASTLARVALRAPLEDAGDVLTHELSREVQRPRL